MKNEKTDPKVKFKDDDRITLEGTTKDKMNNISILLRNVDFSDMGKYTCHVKNPKENNLQHQATILLRVVDKCMQWGLGPGSGVGRTGGPQLSATGTWLHGPRCCVLVLHTCKSSWKLK